MFSQIAPYLGYLASLLLAISLVVNNDLKFRWLNTCGNIAFVTYGAIIYALPVIVTNSILLTINIFYLYRRYNRKETFELLEFQHGGILVDRFLEFYKKDITAFFPNFTREDLDGNINFVVLRDLVIANIFSARTNSDGDAEVIINYTVPKYRDFKVGSFIFEKEKRYLLSKGIRRVYYKDVAHPNHRRFLKISGFTMKNIDGHPVILRDI